MLGEMNKQRTSRLGYHQRNKLAPKKHHRAISVEKKSSGEQTQRKRTQIKKLVAQDLIVPESLQQQAVELGQKLYDNRKE